MNGNGSSWQCLPYVNNYIMILTEFGSSPELFIACRKIIGYYTLKKKLIFHHYGLTNSVSLCKLNLTGVSKECVHQICIYMYSLTWNTYYELHGKLSLNVQFPSIKCGMVYCGTSFLIWVVGGCHLWWLW